MPHTFRHGEALRQLDQRDPATLRVTPHHAPPMPPEPDYYCPTCGDGRDGTTFEQRGVVHLVCEICDRGGLVKMGDL